MDEYIKEIKRETYAQNESRIVNPDGRGVLK